MKRYWPILLIILATAFVSKNLFTRNFYYTHDGDYHISRGLQAVTALKEGHFPLRWASGLNSGCGVPVFNFFYPLVYYLMSLTALAGLDLFFSWKLISALSLLIGTVSFYLLSYQLSRHRLISLTSALIYLFTPYRFLKIYVNGNPEFLTYALLPLLLYALQIRHNLLVFISAFGYLLSHNVAVLVTFPIIVLFIIFWQLWRRQRLMVSLILAFTASLFFWGPALAETGYVRLGHQVAVDYRYHFPTFFQLIRSAWGWGYSQFGPNDGESFQIGYVQIIIFIFFAILTVFRRSAARLSLLTVSLIYLFLILPLSLPVWSRLPLLPQVQFPWRLLGPLTFLIALMILPLLKSLPQRLLLPGTVFLILLALTGNRNHLYSQPHLQPLSIDTQSTSTIGDEILSANATSPCRVQDPFLSQNNSPINLTMSDLKPYRGTISLNSTSTPPPYTLKLEYYPMMYRFFLNGSSVDYRDCSGRVCLDSSIFKSGQNLLSWQIVQTPLQRLFNAVSFTAFAVFILLSLYPAAKKLH